MSHEDMCYMVRSRTIRAFDRGIVCACPTFGFRDIAVLVKQSLITVVYP